MEAGPARSAAGTRSRTRGDHQNRPQREKALAQRCSRTRPCYLRVRRADIGPIGLAWLGNLLQGQQLRMQPAIMAAASKMSGKRSLLTSYATTTIAVWWMM